MSASLLYRAGDPSIFHQRSILYGSIQCRIKQARVHVGPAASMRVRWRSPNAVPFNKIVPRRHDTDESLVRHVGGGTNCFRCIITRNITRSWWSETKGGVRLRLVQKWRLQVRDLSRGGVEERDMSPWCRGVGRNDNFVSVVIG